MENIIYEGKFFNRPDFYERQLFRSKTARVLLKHILVKQPCELCGDIEVHAHHEKYSDYLNIRWLCPIHHKKIHSLFNKINTTEECNKAIDNLLNGKYSPLFDIMYNDNLKFIKDFYNKYGLKVEQKEIEINKG